MELVQSSLLNEIGGIKHGFFRPGSRPGESSRRDSNLSFKNGLASQVLEARKQACDTIGVRHVDLTHVYQVHGTSIFTVDQTHRGAGALTGEDQVGQGDALITSEPDVPLAILIADCLPVFFATGDASAVGLSHAGWKGTLNGLASKTAERLTSDFSIEPKELRVWIGPGISMNGFTVGHDVWELFQNAWSEFDDCFDESRRCVDLKRLNFHQLTVCGVLSENIEVSPDCTFGDPRYFSYRREGPGIGHNMAVIQNDFPIIFPTNGYTIAIPMMETIDTKRNIKIGTREVQDG